ncbi:MAG: long-chain fatty acid--CoA ligase [Dermatophilus congolensis]|nr:long-chain fatty acid--CoA ligase [Dermatophilus congolensis]
MPLLAARDEVYDRARLENLAPSVGHLLRQRIRETPSEDAYLYFDRDENLVTVSWAEAGRQVDEWAAGLMELGVQLGDCVALCSNTRYEWAIANWGIMCAGAATSTIYASSLAGDVAHVLSDSGAKVVIAEDASQVGKVLARKHETPDLQYMVVLDPDGVEMADWIISAEELLRRGKAALEANPSMVSDRVDQLTPEHLAVLIYTSGTTGKPKGAELPHSALTFIGASIHAAGLLEKSDLQFLWLPLAHVFGNVMLVLPVDIGLPTAIDGRLDRIVEHCAIIKPTFMAAAPRIFEKAYARVQGTFDEATGLKAKLIPWALGVGHQMAVCKEKGEEPGRALAVQHAIADKLVLSKVRARFGGRLDKFISGSAKLDPKLSWWFASIGMPILEGYGLSETSAATCVNRNFPGAHKHGSIGWPVPGMEVKTDTDGELLIRGPGVMRGYHNRPDATAEVFTEDGFFRTGDVAEIDERGFVTITDRKKDVFKTSGGKFVAPSVIESKFKALCPLASQFIVIGDGRNFASALIALDPEAITAWAAANGMEGASYSEIVASDAAKTLVQGYIDQLNEGLNRWETIKQFRILPRDLTVDDGDLTPSLKLRRGVVTKEFATEIDDMYTG